MLTISGREIPENDIEVTAQNEIPERDIVVSAQKALPLELSNKNIVIAISLGKYLSGGKSVKGSKEVLSEIEILRGYLDLVNNAHYDCLLAKKKGIKGVIFYVGDEIHSGDFHIIARDPETVISGNSTPAISDEDLRVCLKKMDLTFLKGCDLSDPKEKGIAEKHLALEFEKIFIPYTRKLGAVYLNKIKESNDAKDSWSNLAVPYQIVSGPYWKQHKNYFSELKAAENLDSKAEDKYDENEQAIRFKKLIDNDVVRHQKSYGYLIKGAEKRIKANAAAIGITIPDELSFENMSRINCRYFHLSEVAQNRCLTPGTRVLYRGSSPESLEPTCNDKEYDLRWIDMRIESVLINKRSNTNNICGRSSHLEQSYVSIYPEKINQLRSYFNVMQLHKQHDDNLRRMKEEQGSRKKILIVPEVKPRQRNNHTTDNIISSLQKKKDLSLENSDHFKRKGLHELSSREIKDSKYDSKISKTKILIEDEKYFRTSSASIAIPKEKRSPLLSMSHFGSSLNNPLTKDAKPYDRGQGRIEEDDDINVKLSPPRSQQTFRRSQAVMNVIDNPEDHVKHFLKLFRTEDEEDEHNYAANSKHPTYTQVYIRAN